MLTAAHFARMNILACYTAQISSDGRLHHFDTLGSLLNISVSWAVPPMHEFVLGRRLVNETIWGASAALRN